MAKQIDTVTVEVVRNLLMSIAEETYGIIVRSAYSTNMKERRDVCTAVIDPDGNSVAQVESLAALLGSMLSVVPNIYEKFGKENVRPGDMFIANDPYHGGGNHLPDIVIAAPAFAGDKLVGWIANIAHHSDIGGKVPGSTSGDADSLFQEGIRIPVIRIRENNETISSVLDLLLDNTRVPQEREGDLTAQMSANLIGVQRIQEAYARYQDDLIACMKELVGYSERRVRAVVAELPDGEYNYTDYVDGCGDKYPDPLPIKVKVTIKGDDLTIDFTGTADQIKAPINVPYPCTKAAVFFAVKALMGDDIPANEGINRAIKIIAPKGCIVNPTEPSPIGAQAVPGIGKAALKIGVFTDQISEFRKMLKEETPIKDVIEAILDKTGYRDELKEEGEVEAESRMENIEELINKAVSYWESAEEPSLSAFLEEVALVADIDSMDESEDRIILMTLHSAKGLEFPYVYLAGMEDGLFPSMMSLMEGPEALEEERRLCYVGITRAEKRLTLTAAKSRMIKGQVQPERTSRFIDEIPDVCLERPDRDDSKTGWKKMADAYRNLPEEAGLPWAKASGADGKAADGHTGRFQNRPAGVSLFGQKSDAYKNPYASGTSAAPKNTPTFGKAFTVEKPKSLDYSEGDRVHHMRFGDGTVKSIADGGKDFEVTVDFDNAAIGTRKMFASFAKLKKL